MVNLNRVKTVVLYSWYHLTHSMETWVDLVWFPIVEILVFGFLARFIDDSQITQLVLFGLINWEIIRVIQYSITLGVMWDVWSKNFSSLFVTPLSLSEFVCGHFLSSLLKAVGLTVILSLLSWALYVFWFWDIGLAFVLYFGLLALFALSASMFVIALILRYGTDVQSLSWSMIFLFQPLSAVVYPVEVLPSQIRWLAFLSPVTYVMEAARFQLRTGQMWWSYLGMSLLVSVFYLAGAGWFLRSKKKWAHKTGAFARMEM